MKTAPLNTAVMFSKASDHWTTPKALYDALDAEFHFTFDPCPRHPDFDGLAVPWPGSVFINPPYSNIAAFLKKGLDELRAEHTHTLVYLVPARTDTQWFHTYCYGKAELRFLKGRLKFGDATNSAPFPSMLVIFRRPPP